MGYGESTAGYYLDTARYVRIQLDTVGYSGIQWICCKMAKYRSIYRDTRDIYQRQGYGEIHDTGGMQITYRRNVPKIHARGRLYIHILYTNLYNSNSAIVIVHI